MDDWDPTDRVIVIVHETGPAALGDDGPTVTTPPREDEPTERHHCEFDEDTVEEYDWAPAPN